jgi:hypothetical protein
LAQGPDIKAEGAASIEDRRLARLYAYWCSKRPSAGAWPSREAIDPLDIPQLLPYLMLVEIHGPDRFFFRLVGTNVARGIDPTGTYLADGAPGGPYRDHILAVFGEMPRRGQPVYTISLYDDPEHDQRRTHRLFLPLEPKGGDPPLMLIGQVTEQDRMLLGSLWEIAPTRISVATNIVLDGAPTADR